MTDVPFFEAIVCLKGPMPEGREQLLANSDFTSKEASALND